MNLVRAYVASMRRLSLRGGRGIQRLLGADAYVLARWLVALGVCLYLCVGIATRLFMLHFGWTIILLSFGPSLPLLWEDARKGRPCDPAVVADWDFLGLVASSSVGGTMFYLLISSVTSLDADLPVFLDLLAFVMIMVGGFLAGAPATHKETRP